MPTDTLQDALQKANRIALVICVFFVLIAISYASVTPLFEGPDESAHFLYIHNLLTERRLPVLERRDIVFESRATQRHHPPLYYLMGAALVSWTNRSDVEAYLRDNPFATTGTVSPNNQNVYLHPLEHSGDTYLAIWILRLFSITLGTITVWFVYRIGLIVTAKPSLALMAMLLAACIPQFIFISSNINNDNLVTLSYTIGLYYVLRLWHKNDQLNEISWHDTLILSVVMAVAALSKLTGLTLYFVVYLSITLGVSLKKYSWQSALRFVLMSLLIGITLSGWWYIRNWSLYGDPLALRATQLIWGRGPITVTGSELVGLWNSFWMILGYFNIRGPEWLYVYATLLTCVGLVGAAITVFRSQKHRSLMLWLFLVCILVAGSVIAATRQINVSQGRLLFPAIGAFMCLLIIGWHTLIKHRISALLVVPFALLSVFTPAQYLRTAYMPLTTVSELPKGTHSLFIQAETLAIRGYQLASNRVENNIIRLWVYFSGWHSRNPNLFIKALDPVSANPIGTVDIYPGMVPTDSLKETDTIYKAEIRFPIDTTGLATPFRIALQIGWNQAGQFLPLVDETGRQLQALIVHGPTWDAFANPLPPAIRTNVNYDDNISLVGYTLSNTDLSAGTTFDVTLHWKCQYPLSIDLTATVGIYDQDKRIIAQADGIPQGYPTSAWVCGREFIDTRTLTIPADVVPGNYKLFVGWYDPVSGVRLAAKGNNVVPENLFEADLSISGQ